MMYGEAELAVRDFGFHGAIASCERGERLRGRGREEREGLSGLQLVSKETIQLLPSLKDFDLQISS